MGEQEYTLGYSLEHRIALRGLKQEVKKTGEQLHRLIVYPRILHFPGRDSLHKLMFKLVAYGEGQNVKNGLELKENEFHLRGLWQFIPVCKTPCVSVFRNFSEQRLDYLKQGTPQQRLNFLKPSHVPILWRDAPVRPFRFNPKADKEEQGSPFFVEVKAKLLLPRNLFGFDSLLAMPIEEPPRFLKPRKVDKAAAQEELKGV